MRVAQPVEGDVWHAGLIHERDEVVVSIVVVKGRPDLTGKHQVVILPRRTEGQSTLVLPDAMLLQRRDAGRSCRARIREVPVGRGPV